ncbi:MAG: response regulator [bacterium]|nr:response regulator [bacterium]
MGIILAIDNDEAFLELLLEKLHEIGHTIITALSADEGLKLALTINPDLVILETELTGLDGYDVLENLRINELTRYIPVIVMTVDTKKQKVLKAIKYGIKDFLSKQFDVENLVRKINSAVVYNKKLQKRIGGERENAVIEIRQTSKTSISIRSSLKFAQRELQGLLTPQFLNLVENKQLILDLRYMPGLTREDVIILKKLIDLVPQREIYMVSGKYFGLISLATTMGKRIKHFISYDDMDTFAYNRGDNKDLADSL